MGGSFKGAASTDADGNMQITGLSTTLSLLFPHKRLDRYRTNAIILFIAVKKGVLYTSVSSLPYKKKVRISREFQKMIIYRMTAKVL